VRDLRDRGFAVAMIDWRAGPFVAPAARPAQSYVCDFSDYEVDVETFVQQVVLPDCPPPHFALAHSMGGAVMLRVAHAGKRWFDRMVLSAPMIDLPGHRTGCRHGCCCGRCGWPGRVAAIFPAAATRSAARNPSSTIP